MVDAMTSSSMEVSSTIVLVRPGLVQTNPLCAVDVIAIKKEPPVLLRFCANRRTLSPRSAWKG